MNAVATPFSILVGLARKSQRTARPLPTKVDTQTHWAGLGLQLLGQRFVVPLGEVTEMLRVPQYTRLPGVKNFVLGVANIRGRLMPIVDLAPFFGEPSSVPRSQRRVVVVEDDDNYCGYMIDESLGMQHFPADSFDDGATAVDARFLPYVVGSYMVAGNRWQVLSLGALAADPGLEKLG